MEQSTAPTPFHSPSSGVEMPLSSKSSGNRPLAPCSPVERKSVGQPALLLHLSFRLPQPCLCWAADSWGKAFAKFRVSTKQLREA